MTIAAAASRSELEEIALTKLTRVLGQETGRRVFDETLAKAGIKAIQTPDELFVFAQMLSKSKGFEGAVGGLLSVTAVMRGAVERPS